MNAPTVGQTRVVIVGATGMVGGYAVRHALDRPAIRSVTAIVRRKLGISDPKLKEVLHQNFAECSALAESLSGQDAGRFLPRRVYRCRAGHRAPHDNRGLHDRVRPSSPREQPRRGVLILEREWRADPTGRSRMPFARYKGQAENALLAARFPRVYIFRPAYIYPVAARKEPNFSYRLLRAIYPAFRVLFPNQVIRADDLARVMVDVSIRRIGEQQSRVFENRDIRAMVVSLHTPEG